MYTFVIQQEIRQALARRGIKNVDIDLCADELWTADRLSHVARIRLRPTRSSVPRG
jgi:metal-sulfur cluster biosynthetic enzyme